MSAEAAVVVFVKLSTRLAEALDFALQELDRLEAATDKTEEQLANLAKARKALEMYRLVKDTVKQAASELPPSRNEVN